MNGVLIKGPAVMIRTRRNGGTTMIRPVASPRTSARSPSTYREDGSLAIDLALELMADAGDLEIAADPEGAWFVRAHPGLVWKEGAEAREQGNSEGLSGAAVAGAKAKWLVCQGTEAKGRPRASPSSTILPIPATGGLDGAGGRPHRRQPFRGSGGSTPVIPNGESIRFRYRNIFFRGPAEGIDLAKAYEAFAAR